MNNHCSLMNLGSVDGSIYSGGDVRPSLMQFGYAQPDSPDAATVMFFNCVIETDRGD
jgi:hypothetical protein